jgi:hypothetical protein
MRNEAPYQEDVGSEYRIPHSDIKWRQVVSFTSQPLYTGERTQ